MKTAVAKKDFDLYLQEARSWETDKIEEIERSRKMAWRVAIASGGIAFVSVLALAALTPLKQVEPFVIRVDNSSGIVDVVAPLKDGKQNYDEAINKYFTQWYVRYREGYSKELAEDYYTTVGLMSAPQEQQKYYEWFNPKNPQSPLNLYSNYAKVKIHIKGTSFIKPTVALVRYTKEVERGGDKPQLTHWAATINFAYSGAPMSEKDRAINPLGFQVIEYRNDPDALPPDATAPEKPMTAPATPTGPTVFPMTATPSVPAIQH
ncbi:MAG: hypothetical protein RIR70_593 [Pseudomonadota bacterium]|jgi:type IV secretion system protein VirB8